MIKMPVQTFICDTRTPVGENISKKSIEHPCNIARNSIMIENQATADAVYDPYPTRVEPFVGSAEYLTFYVALAVIVLSLGGLLYFPQTPMRVFLILTTMWSIHYAVGMIPNATV